MVSRKKDTARLNIPVKLARSLNEVFGAKLNHHRLP
jgi:hypothetical protein